jgi:DNA-directed RNA polymerase subunit omega
MSHVPIEDLMDHVDSKYRLVIVAAKRAKQLNRGGAPLIQARSCKPTYQALEEIATGKLGYEIEPLAAPVAPEVHEAEGKPTWFRSLSAEEAVPEEAAVEVEERFEEEEPVVAETAEAGTGTEDLAFAEFEEESLEELDDIDVTGSEEGEE